jgi:hypothetical protein
MNTLTPSTRTFPAIGSQFEDGWLAGIIRGQHAIILPPKAVSEHLLTRWNKSNKRVVSALSYWDGQANTEAMAKSGSEVAQWALDNGFYIPARDELEPMYRHFKPGTYVCDQWRSGDNPSSEPAGYPYTEKRTVQTLDPLFQQDGAEAFHESSYWSSTQYAGDDVSAWCQHFDDGDQYDLLKSSELRVRAVRRLKI